MRTAIAYLRVSTGKQAKGDGFPRQLAAIRRYAKANGIRITKVYREATRGTNDLDSRPALSQLLLGNGARLVLIERLDRLARDLMVQETIIGDLGKHGFRLVSVTEPDLLRNDPTRKLMRQVFGAIAEYERAMLVAKLRAARERKKARTGRCEGVKPYGHYPGERRTLERMRQLRGQGLGYDAVAATLTAEGMPTRKGTAWHAAGVRRILVRQP